MGVKIKLKEDSSRAAIKIAATAVFPALVCVVTLVFVVGIPATNGYFNVGETVIYIAALSFGPYVGAFAGGIGAAIADLIAAPIFARNISDKRLRGSDRRILEQEDVQKNLRLENLVDSAWHSRRGTACLSWLCIPPKRRYLLGNPSAFDPDIHYFHTCRSLVPTRWNRRPIYCSSELQA